MLRCGLRQGELAEKISDHILYIFRIDIRIFRQAIIRMGQDVAFAIIRAKCIPDKFRNWLRNAIRDDKVYERGRRDSIPLGSEIASMPPPVPTAQYCQSADDNRWDQ